MSYSLGRIVVKMQVENSIKDFPSTIVSCKINYGIIIMNHNGMNDKAQRA